MDDLKNKTVLVLGSNGDIGSAIADAFQKHGAKVCRHSFVVGDPYYADVRHSETVKQLLDKAVADLGRVDVLINAIGAAAIPSPFEKKDWDDFNNQLQTQLKSAVETSHYLVPLMKEWGGGKIIHILSSYVAGQTPTGLSDYVTAKYALLGFTKSLAREVGRYHITVNAVSPGFIRNNFTKNIPAKFDELLIHETPLGRLTEHRDVADATLFLASAAADFITGENLVVDGGNTL